MKHRICRLPFEQAIFRPESIAPCCWIKKDYPFNYQGTFEDYLSSDYLKDLKNKLCLGDFSLCTDSCPELYYARKPLEESSLTQEPPSLKQLYLSYDRSCNLQCPSCRETPYFEKDKCKDFEVFLKSIGAYAKEVETIYLSGAGEALASEHHRSWLFHFKKENYPKLKTLILHTNLVLFDEAFWQSLPSDLKKLKLWLNISIDSFDAETYEKIRRGASFNTFYKNLLFVKSLKQSQKISRMDFSFVLQKSNFRELSSMVRRSFLEWKADYIMLKELEVWTKNGHYEEEAVACSASPYYEEYLSLLSDPHLIGALYDGKHQEFFGSRKHFVKEGLVSPPWTNLNFLALRLTTELEPHLPPLLELYPHLKIIRNENEMGDCRYLLTLKAKYFSQLQWMSLWQILYHFVEEVRSMKAYENDFYHIKGMNPWCDKDSSPCLL